MLRACRLQRSGHLHKEGQRLLHRQRRQRQHRRPAAQVRRHARRRRAAAADRVPDTNGWYNHPLTVTFSGTDATAGFAGCSSVQLQRSGHRQRPRSAAPAPTTPATSTTASLPFKYDATAPTADRGRRAAPRTPTAGTTTRSPSASPAATPPPASPAARRPSATTSGHRQAPPSAAPAPTTPATSARPACRSNTTPRRRPRPQPRAAPRTPTAGTTIRSPSRSPATTPPPESPAAPPSSYDGSGQRERRRSAAPAPTTPATSTTASLPFKYDATAADRDRSREPRPGHQRLVQPPAHGQLRRQRRHRRPRRLLRTGRLQHRQRKRLRQRLLHRQRRQRRHASLPLKYDATAPTATAAASRAADTNGWYNHPLTVTFSGTDATAGIAGCSCRPATTLRTTASATVSGSCTDNAGNVTTASLPFKYDATAADRHRSREPRRGHQRLVQPSAHGQLRRQRRHRRPRRLLGTGRLQHRQRNASVSGSCTDNAGNVGTPACRSNTTPRPPTATAAASRAADTNGWYNHPLTVTFSGHGRDRRNRRLLLRPVRRSGQRSATVSGSCTDNAGNVDHGKPALQIRRHSPPTATAAASRAADTNGWYNHPLTVSFAGSDTTAGLAGCSAPVGYSTDNGSASVSGSCTDNAGNVGTTSLPLKYDATAPPAATAEPSRAPNANGWYKSALTVRFSGTDATAGLAGCSSPTDYSGPDSVGVTVVGFCTDNAGNVTTASLPFKYDATPPPRPQPRAAARTPTAGTTTRSPSTRRQRHHRRHRRLLVPRVQRTGQRKRHRERLLHRSRGQRRDGEPGAQVRLGAACR